MSLLPEFSIYDDGVKYPPKATCRFLHGLTDHYAKAPPPTSGSSQEMLYTGRPFTAKEMHDCSFVNSVVVREKLEEETMKYALACSRSRPTDIVVVQKTFMEIYKQYRDEYMGSLLAGWMEGMLPMMRTTPIQTLSLATKCSKSAVSTMSRKTSTWTIRRNGAWPVPTARRPLWLLLRQSRKRKKQFPAMPKKLCLKR